MDDARFDRQRRNVMVTSSLLVAAWIVRANFTSFTVFGLTAASPHRVGTLWAILIAYFMWRLSQMAGKEQRDDKQALFEEVLIEVLTKIATKQVQKEVAEELSKEAQTRNDKLISSLVLLVNNGASYDREEYKFKAKFFVSSKWKTAEGDSNESSSRTKTFVATQPEFEIGIRRAKILVLFKRKTFTEYQLPYLLGTAAVVLGCLEF